MAPIESRTVHLLGGGWDEDAARALYDPFVAQADGPIVVIVEDGESSAEYGQRFVDVLQRSGATAPHVLTVGDRPPSPSVLAAAGGVLIGGGLTPRYHQALVARGCDWLPPDVPYLGFSAGAAIAPVVALLGGWLTASGKNPRVICPQDNGEDLEPLTIRPGLALVPWMIDVHASHRGTLSRLVHAVRDGHSDTGFAIDENTSLTVDGGRWRVAGGGFVYEVIRDGADVLVRTHAAG